MSGDGPGVDIGPERQRLKEDAERQINWKRWGDRKSVV